MARGAPVEKMDRVVRVEVSRAEMVLGRADLERVGLNTAGYCRIPQVTAGDRRVSQDTFISKHITLF